MSKEQKTTNKNKAIKMPIIIIIIIVIAIIAYFKISNKTEQSETTKQQQNEQTKQTEQNTEQTGYSLIDMNNTENAKIEGESKENTSSKLAEEKTFQGMKIKDIKLKAEGGITTLTATVENTSSKKYEGGAITIIFTNKDGSEFARLEGILPEIESGKTNELDAGTTADIANAYDFRIE